MPSSEWKSVSRRQSRKKRSISSSNSSCSRQSPRDNAPSLLRGDGLLSLSANRFSVLGVETPSLFTPLQPESRVRKIRQKVGVRKQVKLPEATIAPQNLAGILLQGVRCLMLLLLSLLLSVWGSPAQKSSKSKGKKPIASKFKKHNNRSAAYPSKKELRPSLKTSSSSVAPGLSLLSSSSSEAPSLSASPVLSSSLSEQETVPPLSLSASASRLSLSSWTSSNSSQPSQASPSSSTSSDAEEIAIVASSGPSSSPYFFVPAVQSFETEESDSDDMVSAREDLDDSLNEQWSTALTMNTSIDSESFNHQDSSNFSLDQEVASIFSNGRSSVSSDDEDSTKSNGRRINMFLRGPFNFEPRRPERLQKKK